MYDIVFTSAIIVMYSSGSYLIYKWFILPSFLSYPVSELGFLYYTRI